MQYLKAAKLYKAAFKFGTSESNRKKEIKTKKIAFFMKKMFQKYEKLIR